MAFVSNAWDKVATGIGLHARAHAPPPGAPPIPNPNDAANAAQSQTDALRARRGLLNNIYAGGQAGAASQPVAGKTQLGT